MQGEAEGERLARRGAREVFFRELTDTSRNFFASPASRLHPIIMALVGDTEVDDEVDVTLYHNTRSKPLCFSIPPHLTKQECATH